MPGLMGIGYAEIALLTTGATVLVSMAAFLRVKRPVPVLFITDIGRDIDDTLALFALEAYQRQGLANVVGVVTTGGMGKERARLTRGWLRRLGLADDIPVAACIKPGREVCDIESFETPQEEDANIYKKSAADLILDLARIHKGKLLVFAVAPLTPLADAIETAEGLSIVRKGVACLNIQGQATFENNKLMPDFQAFNLSENKEASEAVFDKLQNHVPFRLLGKHAAYRVSLTREDFTEWDQMIMPPGSLIRTVKNGLQGLKESVPSPDSVP
jgi:inosine-uridine nucleoside N-ribohydrolase